MDIPVFLISEVLAVIASYNLVLKGRLVLISIYNQLLPTISEMEL